MTELIKQYTNEEERNLHLITGVSFSFSFSKE
jgi:hypothetical protein